MTPAQQPEHCEHECVCLGVGVQSNFRCPLDSGFWKKCSHDTRSRSHPPALYKTQVDDDGAVGKVAICLCDQCKVNGFLCEKSPRAISPHTQAPEPVCLGELDCHEITRTACSHIDKCFQQHEHDASIARAATLATLDDIPEFLAAICFVDLWQYVRNEMEAEDITHCRGKDCNYCGKFNESSRRTAGDEQE